MELSYTKPTGLLSCLRTIVQTEGVQALFKGLGPNLVGVAPSRAIYFGIYATAKTSLNKSGLVQSESKFVHMGAACSAGMLLSSLSLLLLLARHFVYISVLCQNISLTSL